MYIAKALRRSVGIREGAAENPLHGSTCMQHSSGQQPIVDNNIETSHTPDVLYLSICFLGLSLFLPFVK